MFGRAPQLALVEVLEAVAGRFTGRELALNIRGHGVSLRIADVPGARRAGPTRPTIRSAGSPTRCGVRDVRALDPSRARWASTTWRPCPVETVSSMPPTSTSMRCRRHVSPARRRRAPRSAIPFPEVVTGSITSTCARPGRGSSSGSGACGPTGRSEPRRDELWSRGPGWRFPLLVRPTLDPSTVHTEAVGAVVLGKRCGSLGSWYASVRSRFRRSTRHSSSIDVDDPRRRRGVLVPTRRRTSAPPPRRAARRRPRRRHQARRRHLRLTSMLRSLAGAGRRAPIPCTPWPLAQVWRCSSRRRGSARWRGPCARVRTEPSTSNACCAYGSSAYTTGCDDTARRSSAKRRACAGTGEDVVSRRGSRRTAARRRAGGTAATPAPTSSGRRRAWS